MSSGKKNSPEFKAKVGYEAALASKKLISELAAKYKVSEDEVITWSGIYGGSHIAEEATEAIMDHDDHAPAGVDVEISSANDEFVVAVGEGVTNDSLPYSKLGMWITIGLTTVVALIVFASQLQEYMTLQKERRVSNASTYTEITRLQAEQNEQLNSFGVVDGDNGVYSVPIDSAINKMLEK